MIDSIHNDPLKKEENLRHYLRQHQQVLIAYSGGVDSTYLTYVTFTELGKNMLAVLSIGSSFSAREQQRAIQFLKKYSIPNQIIVSGEEDDPNYIKNDKNRCYYCKKALFSSCEKLRKTLDWKFLAYGFNTDDICDYRPGQKAANEYQILRPLFDVKMTKSDIRNRSEALGLRDPFRPAQPCLSSRLIYGTPVTETNLRIIESMEDFLDQLGFSECRARYDGHTIRIELPENDIEKITKNPVREKIVQYALSLGVSFITLDLEGFVSGKLNRLLRNKDEKAS